MPSSETGLPTPEKPEGWEDPEADTETDEWTEQDLPFSRGEGIAMLIVVGLVLLGGGGWLVYDLTRPKTDTPQGALEVAVQAATSGDVERFEQVVPLEEALQFSFQAFADSMTAYRQRQAETAEQELRARMGGGFLQGLEPVVVRQGQALIREAIRSGQISPPQNLGTEGTGQPRLQFELLETRITKRRTGRAQAEIQLQAQSGNRSRGLLVVLQLQKRAGRWQIRGVENGFRVLESLQQVVAPQAQPATSF